MKKKLFEKKETVELINTIITDDDMIIIEHLANKGKKSKVIDRLDFDVQEAKELIKSLEKAISMIGEEEPNLIATL